MTALKFLHVIWTSGTLRRDQNVENGRNVNRNSRIAIGFFEIREMLRTNVALVVSCRRLHRLALDPRKGAKEAIAG